MNRSAIILAGGHSKRFGQDKGLLNLAGKPLIRYVIDAVNDIVDEKTVVVSSKEQADKYSQVVGSSVNVTIDKTTIRSPLAGALTGFEDTRGEYSLLLACDTPFIIRDILDLLLELCTGRNACVPRWPNGHIEPLHAVYRRQPALQASKIALERGELDVRYLLDILQCVRYVSTLVLEQLDPKLKSFFNINTALDLRAAQQMLKSPRSPSPSVGR